MYREGSSGSDLIFQNRSGMSVYVRDPIHNHSHINDRLRCVNNTMIEEGLNCGYKKVRNLPASSSAWFKANDNLGGIE
jgi:hypothetical protein